MRAMGTLLLLIAGLALGALAAELAAQVYVYAIAKKGKRFQPDERLGWIPLPGLSLTRKNADGEPYLIETDQASIRGPSSFPDDPGAPRLLLLGDSFAFGEGVALEARFDARIAAHVPGLTIVSLGVPGYGTEQQVIRARDRLDELRPGDALLLLFYGRDYLDVARTRHSARSKPWIELTETGPVEHAPRIGWLERIRDKSYIVSVLASRFEVDSRFEARLQRSDEIVQAILEPFAAELSARGIVHWLAFHGMETIETPFDAHAAVERHCRLSFRCIDLDPVLAGRPEKFLSDGHWTAEGHALIGDFLGKALAREWQAAR